MNTYDSNSISPHGQEQLEALRRSVAKALDRKRRLGQYAVIWQNGKPGFIGADAPETPETMETPEGLRTSVRPDSC